MWPRVGVRCAAHLLTREELSAVHRELLLFPSTAPHVDAAKSIFLCVDLQRRDPGYRLETICTMCTQIQCMALEMRSHGSAYSSGARGCKSREVHGIHVSVTLRM